MKQELINKTREKDALLIKKEISFKDNKSRKAFFEAEINKINFQIASLKNDNNDALKSRQETLKKINELEQKLKQHEQTKSGIL